MYTSIQIEKINQAAEKLIALTTPPVHDRFHDEIEAQLKILSGYIPVSTWEPPTYGGRILLDPYSGK